jgi:hypothetical protein
MGVVRVYKTIKRAVCSSLFTKKISANDCDQGGNLGDCYYVASLAAIANKEPELIPQIITEFKPGYNKAKFYDVFDYSNLQFKDEWVEVEVQIDDQIEYEGEAPKYSYSKEDPAELWFPLLEKAYAAWKGSYDAIGNGGYPDVALSELTGRKSFCVSTAVKYFKSEGMRKNVLLGIFEKADRNNYKVVCCTGGSGEIQDSKNPDVYTGHAYTYIKYDHDTHLITLRNPWGEGTNPEGYFEITVPDFLKYYDSICYIA